MTRKNVLGRRDPVLRPFLALALGTALLACGRSEQAASRTGLGESGDAALAADPHSAARQTVPGAPPVEIRARQDTIGVGESVTLRIFNRGRDPVYWVPCDYKKEIRAIPTVMALGGDEWRGGEVSFCGNWNEDAWRHARRIEPGDSLMVPWGPFSSAGTWRLRLSFRPSPRSQFSDSSCCYSNPFEVIE